MKTLTDVAEIIGPYDTRYFGSGYRRTGYDFTPTWQSLDPDRCEYSGTAQVVTPQVWSLKSGGNQRPHLSTVDAIRLADIATVDALAMRCGQSDDFAYERLTIRAGTTAVEDGLRAVKGHGIMTRLAEEPRRRHFDCALADFALDWTVRARPEDAYRAIENYIRSGSDTAAADYSRRIHTISFHDDGTETSNLTGRIDFSSNAESPTTDIGPCSTGGGLMTDGFCIVLQLAQILLYRLDHMTRDSSNTLWMRRTTIEADHTIPADFVHVELGDARLVRRSPGDLWRLTEITGTALEHRISCSVAHRLPESTARSH